MFTGAALAAAPLLKSGVIPNGIPNGIASGIPSGIQGGTPNEASINATASINAASTNSFQAPVSGVAIASCVDSLATPTQQWYGARILELHLRTEVVFYPTAAQWIERSVSHPDWVFPDLGYVLTGSEALGLTVDRGAWSSYFHQAPTLGIVPISSILSSLVYLSDPVRLAGCAQNSLIVAPNLSCASVVGPSVSTHVLDATWQVSVVGAILIGASASIRTTRMTPSQTLLAQTLFAGGLSFIAIGQMAAHTALLTRTLSLNNPSPIWF